eukprot:g1621.t1
MAQPTTTTGMRRRLLNEDGIAAPGSPALSTMSSPDREVLRIPAAGGAERKGMDAEDDLLSSLARKMEDADLEAADPTVLAVFVVHFDTKRGNVIEWVRPAEFDMDGVEYKAMPSGCHNVQEDFVFFKHVDGMGDRCFGLGAFHNMSVDNERERGSRMRSVGVVARSYGFLPRHLDFLTEEAVLLNATPGDFGRIERYLAEHSSGGVTAGAAGAAGAAGVGGGGGDHAAVALPGREERALVETHLARSLTQIASFFGPSIFTIWKALLLRMRILFYTPVPVGAVCNRVHAVCSLATCDERSFHALVEPRPLFFINVADIDEITAKGAESWIACTTEKIFIEKPHLYDVFVDNQNVCVSRQHQSALKLTRGDIIRFQDMMRRGRGGLPGRGGSGGGGNGGGRSSAAGAAGGDAFGAGGGGSSAGGGAASAGDGGGGAGGDPTAADGNIKVRVTI